jgi:ubiquinone/menaquinone biosynthesis C-methylase UbiE
LTSSPLSYRVKLAFFLLCGITVLFLLDTAYQGLNTLSRLNVVEAERDQWQRPTDILQALDLNPGNVVVDLGCGSGYFTLKLSAPVGKSGSVLAEDIRRLPLVFLWLRTFQRRNVSIVHGEPDDPHLPVQRVNAVLIANTYHEFANSQPILVHVMQSLVSGGRLVVVDREPRPVDQVSTGTVAGNHEVSSKQVESELRHGGFEIVSRQDRFIQNDPLNENWWIITARKP